MLTRRTFLKLLGASLTSAAIGGKLAQATKATYNPLNFTTTLTTDGSEIVVNNTGWFREGDYISVNGEHMWVTGIASGKKMSVMRTVS